LLPVAGEEVFTDTPQSAYIFEPSPEAVLSLLMPKYLETVIYGALLQASASELGSRMAAMGNATDNAQELIAKLTLSYNKVRQANITRELAEIVGGAEALK
jgi:F-type H+-transporting ATPase subunit gamma